MPARNNKVLRLCHYRLCFQFVSRIFFSPVPYESEAALVPWLVARVIITSLGAWRISGENRTFYNANTFPWDNKSLLRNDGRIFLKSII